MNTKEIVACPLFGGYILQVNNENLFYPQCCGDLGDIQFWRNISTGKNSYYEGHPQPVISFADNFVKFNLNIREHDEEFTPIPMKRNFEIDMNELKQAITETEKKLKVFAEKLITINTVEHLNIYRIDDLLIWENINY